MLQLQQRSGQQFAPCHVGVGRPVVDDEDNVGQPYGAGEKFPDPTLSSKQHVTQGLAIAGIVPFGAVSCAGAEDSRQIASVDFANCADGIPRERATNPIGYYSY